MRGLVILGLGEPRTVTMVTVSPWRWTWRAWANTDRMRLTITFALPFFHKIVDDRLQLVDALIDPARQCGGDHAQSLEIEIGFDR